MAEKVFETKKDIVKNASDSSKFVRSSLDSQGARQGKNSVLDYKKNVLLVILIVLLIMAIGYIAYFKFKEFKQNELEKVIQESAQQGYENAIIEVARLAVTCQQVPLRIGNQTLNVIAVDCLQVTNNSGRR